MADPGEDYQRWSTVADPDLQSAVETSVNKFI